MEIDRGYSQNYRQLTDEELLRVAADEKNLIEEARLALASELSRRHLTTQAMSNSWSTCSELPSLLEVDEAHSSTQAVEGSAQAVLQHIRQTIPTWRVRDAGIVGIVLLTSLWGVLWGLFIFDFNSRITLPRFYLTRYQRSESGVLLTLVIMLIATAAAVVVIAKVRRLGDPLASIGWNMDWRSILWGAVIGLATTTLVALSSVLFSRPASRFPDGFAPASLTLYFLTAILLGPFIEECYFRGVLFVALSERIGRVGSVIACTLLFALFHIGGYRFLWVFLIVGLVMGLVRVRTRSVTACFASHAAYNTGILIIALAHIGGAGF